MIRIGGMEMNKKSASPKKNCGYSLPDSIMCGDAGKVGHGSGEAAAEKRCTPTVNSLSDSGVRWDGAVCPHL